MINERHKRALTKARASKTALMSDTKWEKIFKFIREYVGVETARFKPLKSEQYYEIALFAKHGYTPDATATGPVKLNLFINPDKPEGRGFYCKLDKLGKFDYELDGATLKIYRHK